MTRNGPPARAYHTLFIAFILAPILIVCWVAFAPLGYLSIPIAASSLRWFRAIASYPGFVTACWSSIALAAISSTVAIALSVPAALAVARHRFPGRDAITALFLS